MTDKITIDEIKTKLERIDYSRFERDFQGHEHQVRAVYWNCVLSDIHFNESSGDFGTCLQQFAVRLHESFLGCFFKAHELHQYVLTRFDGLHKVYRFEEPYNSTWNLWKTDLDKVQAEHLQTILISSREQFDTSLLIKKNSETEVTNLKQFDNYQEYLSQRIYNMFLIHLKYSIFGTGTKPPVKIELPFEIDSRFILSFQNHAKSFLKARSIKYVMNKVDTLFRNDGNFIKAYKRAQPKEAVVRFLKEFPTYRQLSNSQIAYLIRLSYKDEEGQELKLNSIRNALIEHG